MGCDGGTGLKGCREAPLNRDTIIIYSPGRQHISQCQLCWFSHVGIHCLFLSLLPSDVGVFSVLSCIHARPSFKCSNENMKLEHRKILSTRKEDNLFFMMSSGKIGINTVDPSDFTQW